MPFEVAVFRAAGVVKSSLGWAVVGCSVEAPIVVWPSPVIAIAVAVHRGRRSPVAFVGTVLLW